MEKALTEGWAPLEEQVPAEVFKAEVRTWAKRIGVEPREIHIRPMRRKWASCSSKGRLTFDKSLLHQPAAFRAEVIAHELLHMKMPKYGHGKVFRALLRAYLAVHRASSSPTSKA
ncbi:MAG: M48 family metallopeptidase [Dehalococcoidia bacterium]